MRQYYLDVTGHEYSVAILFSYRGWCEKPLERNWPNGTGLVFIRYISGPWCCTNCRNVFVRLQTLRCLFLLFTVICNLTSFLITATLRVIPLVLQVGIMSLMNNLSSHKCGNYKPTKLRAALKFKPDTGTKFMDQLSTCPEQSISTSNLPANAWNENARCNPSLLIFAHLCESLRILRILSMLLHDFSCTM